MIRPRRLHSMRVPLFGQLIVVPYVMRCCGSEQCNRECVKVQFLDKVADDVGSSTVAVDGIGDVTCGFH